MANIFKSIISYNHVRVMYQGDATAWRWLAASRIGSWFVSGTEVIAVTDDGSEHVAARLMGAQDAHKELIETLKALDPIASAAEAEQE